MPRSANAKKTAKKPSKLAWSVVRAHLAQPHAEAALLAAALVAAAQGAALAVVLGVVVAKAAEVADKSHARCTKNACPFKGNPLKRLK
jgi:CubicO group peptidase (beta-lactamase class C family)